MTINLEFEKVDVPEVTRERKANPFASLIEDMQKNGGARRFTMPKKTDADEKAIASAVSQIQSAGRNVGVTVRKKVSSDGKGTAAITVWLVDKITRKVKPKEETAK